MFIHSIEFETIYNAVHQVHYLVEGSHVEVHSLVHFEPTVVSASCIESEYYS